MREMFIPKRITIENKNKIEIGVKLLLIPPSRLKDKDNLSQIATPPSIQTEVKRLKFCHKIAMKKEIIAVIIPKEK